MKVQDRVTIKVSMSSSSRDETVSDLDLILEYLAHQWLPIEVREAYKRLLDAQDHDETKAQITG